MKSFYRILKKPHTWMAAVLIVAFSFPFVGHHANAASSGKGFVIHADSISGKMLPPSIVVRNGQPLVQFQYESATIHGLTLTNVSQTSIGPATLKVQSPLATAKQMVVDASSYSFGGACLKLGEGQPQLVLKDVTLVAQKQTADDMNFEQLQVNTTPGNHGLKRPPVPGLLGGLVDTGSATLQDAIAKLMKGHAPLLQCKANQNEGTQSHQDNQIKKTTDKAKDTVTQTVDQTKNKVNQTVGQAKNTVHQVIGKGENTIGQTVKQVNKTTKNLLGGTGDTVNQLTGDVNKTVNDATSGNLGNVIPDVQKTVCDGIQKVKSQLNNINDQVTAIQNKAEKILSDSQGKHDALNKLIKQVTGTQNQIEKLLDQSLSATQLNQLKDQLSKLKNEEKSLKQIKGQIKNANDSGKLSNLGEQLKALQNQLSQLNQSTICASDSFSQVQTSLNKAQNEVSKGKTESSKLPDQLNKGHHIVGNTVQDVENFVNQPHGGGLLGGLSGILTGLLGNITDLLGSIKDLLQ